MGWPRRQLVSFARFVWFWWLIRAITNNVMVLNRCWLGSARNETKPPADSQ
jgi:hypothetical protein